MSEVQTIKKVLVTVPYKGRYWETLAAALAPAEIIHVTPHKDNPKVKESIGEADVAILGGDISSGELAAGKNLKWIHCDHAGLNKSAHPEVFERGIILTSSAGRSGPVLAEHAFFFMLSLLYDSRTIEKNQRSHKWEKIYEERRGLITKTIGVIGLGNTGKEVVKRAKAFGMRVLGYDRNLFEVPEGIDKAYFKDQGENIDELLKESDIVVLAVRLSDETFHLINERAFDLMKNTAYLVNMARGSVVDEKALYQALIDKKIAGAGCDVFEIEPLPEKSPLWDLPNMLITSHNTPAVADRDGFSLGVICDNIKLFREGKPLRNALDVRDVYTQTVVE